MASNLKKIGICAAIFAFIGALKHRPLWALTTPMTETPPDIGSYQDADTLNAREITDTSNLVSNELLLLANRNIKEMIPASESTVVTDNATRYYITKQPSGQKQAYKLSYRNIWTQQSNLPRKRKVPEPSVIVGLGAMVGWLGTQRRN
ncbi:PEP-CTERM sorting domain-containing protein [Halotia wernerae UHCC 0503]|nr:PEP-CTERM sorting domain-containing protein [Halotia wernerae UHCC 0503]